MTAPTGSSAAATAEQRPTDASPAAPALHRAGDDTARRHEALLGAARDLRPVFEARAPRAEELRRLPPESERDLHESGLYRMLQPRALGGSELPYRCLVDIGATVAAGCAATAWNLTNLSSHHWMLAMFPEAAQDRIWGEDRDALIASSFVFPAGRAKRVPGGYLVSGRWPFSSGVDVSGWNMLAAIVTGDDAPPEHRIFLLPRADYEIIDTWHVVGLKGTGSNDVACDEVFVTEAMSVAAAALKGGETPGSGRHPAPLYRLPVFALFPAILSGVGLGNGEGALEAHVGETRARSARYTGARLAELQSSQIRIGSAAARLSLARRTMLSICDEAMDDAVAGHRPDIVARQAIRRDLAAATLLTTAAVDEIQVGCGAGGLFLAGAQQRRFRDAHAITAHIAFNADMANAAYGRVALGLDSDNPVV